MEESRGNSSGVNQALKNMEQCASRGVVAMLLYHGLTTSDMQDTISVRQFRQHMEALKKAGFHFLTPDEIPAYFAKLNKASDLPRDAAPERAVCVTFDDARRDAMRLATDVARQLNVKFAMNVPVGNVERGDPFICTWEMLKQYQKTGCWVMGSHLLYSHDMLPVSADGQRGCPLINRLWLDKEGRLETTVEFTARIAQEYRRSRELLEQQLGSKVAFMAYPLGDFGQATAGNVTNAAAINLKEAGANYLEGFIQKTIRTIWGLVIAPRWLPTKAVSTEPRNCWASCSRLVIPSRCIRRSTRMCSHGWRASFLRKINWAACARVHSRWSLPSPSSACVGISSAIILMIITGG
ncbi:MAG: polysaccharide deacetylase family protein [Kiritimatiellaeota bacterium]|nr:polysaccharide deacetylase family protein [Kiritimatiellota bacterium]